MIENINSRFLFQLERSWAGHSGLCLWPQLCEAEAGGTDHQGFVVRPCCKWRSKTIACSVCCSSLRTHIQETTQSASGRSPAPLGFSSGFYIQGLALWSGLAEPEDLAMFSFFRGLASLVYLKSHYTDIFLSVHSCTLKHLLSQDPQLRLPLSSSGPSCSVVWPVIWDPHLLSSWVADGHRPSRISQEPLVADYDILTVQSEPEVSTDFSTSSLHDPSASPFWKWCVRIVLLQSCWHLYFPNPYPSLRQHPGVATVAFLHFTHKETEHQRTPSSDRQKPVSHSSVWHTHLKSSLYSLDLQDLQGAHGKLKQKPDADGSFRGGEMR